MRLSDMTINELQKLEKGNHKIWRCWKEYPNPVKYTYIDFDGSEDFIDVIMNADKYFTTREEAEKHLQEDK